LLATGLQQAGVTAGGGLENFSAPAQLSAYANHELKIIPTIPAQLSAYCWIDILLLEVYLRKLTPKVLEIRYEVLRTTPPIMLLAHLSHCFPKCISPSPQHPLTTKSRISLPLPALITAEIRMMRLIIAPPMLIPVRKEDGIVVDGADDDVDEVGKAGDGNLF